MGDDNEEEDRRSTLGPESKVITTTEHVTIHQVTMCCIIISDHVIDQL